MEFAKPSAFFSLSSILFISNGDAFNDTAKSISFLSISTIVSFTHMSSQINKPNLIPLNSIMLTCSPFEKILFSSNTP